MASPRTTPAITERRTKADIDRLARSLGSAVAGARTGEPAHAWSGVAEGLLKVASVQRSGKVVMFTGIIGAAG